MTNIDDWKGSVGHFWAENVAQTDELLRPFGAAGVESLGDVTGLRGLDIGCGAGATAQELTRRGASMTGVDISPQLLAVAKDRDPEGRIHFVQADLSTWTFSDQFDFAFSRFGTMFFNDPVAGMANIRAALTPGAPFVAVSWAERAANEWVTLPMRILKDLLDGPPPPLPPLHSPGPFGWSDADYATSILRDAGWRDVMATAFAHEATLGLPGSGVAGAVENLTRIGPAASLLKGKDGATIARIKETLGTALAPHERGGNVRLQGKAWIFSATA